MSQQKAVYKLERKINSDRIQRNKKFLERQKFKQKNFNFLPTLDCSDPRTQVFLMLLLSANVIGTQATRPPQPGSQSLTSTPKPLADSITPNTHNATNRVTNAPPSSDISIQNRNLAPLTFFSHQFVTAQMSVRKSFLPFKENEVCVVPSRDEVTKPFPLILSDYEKKDFKAVAKKVPLIDDIHTLYTEITLLNAGSEHRIYLATDKDGKKIIVRVNRTGYDLEHISRKLTLPASMILRAYNRLVKTREFSDYIPEIFAVYYTKNTNFNGFSYIGPDDFLFCTEMEFIPKDYQSLYYIEQIDQLMDPRTIFEEVLGNYVTEVVERCNINDPDGDVLRHHLYRENEYPVCYRIGDDIYLLPPGISPHRVDYDNFESLSGTRPFRVPAFLFDHAPEEMKSFLNDINQKGLFESIRLHFSKFLISEEDLKNYPNVKCFSLTELANRELQQSTQTEANANQLKI